MLNLFPEIRPDERRATTAAFFTLFGIMAGHALLETARDALFLAALPPQRLAWVYLAIAVLSFTIFMAQGNRLEPHQHRGRIFLVLCTASVVSLAFWFVETRPHVWVLYTLYVWSGIFATLIIVRFWSYLGELFTVGQAKRLFAPIGAGSVVGAIMGSGMARVLSTQLDSRHILIAAAGMLALTALGPVALLPKLQPSAEPRPGPGPSAREMFKPLRTILDRPYLRRIGAIILTSTLTLTLVDYLFKSTVAQNVEPHRLGAFFSGAYLVFNVLSLAAQVFLVSRLVRVMGVSGVLSILPALVIVGGIGVLAGGGLAAAMILKGFDGALRHSLHRTATEVLYVPVAGEMRSRVKGIIDVIGQRGGQAIGSMVILGVMAVGSASLIFSILILGLSALWIRIAATLKTYYLNLFREALNEVTLQTRFEFPQLDLASLESLISALNSPNDSEVVASLDLLAEQDRVRLIPALILYHPSPRVVSRSLELFARAGRDDFLPLIDRLMERPDPEVRAAVLRATSWVAPNPALYEEFSVDPSPFVRSTALVGMISYGARSGQSKIMLEALADVGTNEEQLALARAINYMPGMAFEGALLKLAESPDLDVKLAAAQAMSQIRSPRFIPTLIDMLAHRSLRRQVRDTLAVIGEESLTKLEEALRSTNLNRSIRRQLPRAIDRFDPERAAAIFIDRLLEENDGAVRYQILRSLGRLRDAHPTLSLDTPTLHRAISETLSSIFRLMDWRLSLRRGASENPRRATPVRDGIAALLGHKENQAKERTFRLLGLLHPLEDVRSIYRGTMNNKRKIRESSLELLEVLVEPPLRDPLLAVVDDIDDNQKLSRAGSYHAPQRLGYEDVLRTLLENGGVGMRCLVAYHVAEIRMNSLSPVLESLPSDTEGLVARSVSRALAVLSREEEISYGG